MNRFDKVALVAVILVTLLSVLGKGSHVDTYYSSQMANGGRPMWVAGWAIATYGPIAIAAGFWRWSKRSRTPWIPHLLFLPCSVFLLLAGQRLMLSVIHDPDFDAMLGAPTLPAYFLFLVAVGTYLAALIAKFRLRQSQQGAGKS